MPGHIWRKSSNGGIMKEINQREAVAYMEFFDICDENGNPTGGTIERTEAHRLGVCHRTAHVWIIREKDGRYQVLLQKRSADKDSFPGRFDTSSAGHIRAGDEPAESAVRELAEELGIQAQPSELNFAGKFRVRYEKEFHGKMFKDNEVAFVYVYRRPVDEKELVLQKEEVECVEWFDMEDVLEGCRRHDRKFCVPVEGLVTAKRYVEGRRD